MKYFTVIFLLSFVQLFFQGCTSNDKIEWADFVPIGSKKVEVNDPMLKRKVKIDWPVFSDKILKFNNTQVELEGYYLALPSDKMIYMITCCPKFTTTVCGRGQFLQHEFCVLSNIGKIEPNKKIRIQGILRLNINCKNDNLIRLENAKVM